MPPQYPLHHGYGKPVGYPVRDLSQYASLLVCHLSAEPGRWEDARRRARVLTAAVCCIGYPDGRLSAGYSPSPVHFGYGHMTCEWERREFLSFLACMHPYGCQDKWPETSLALIFVACSPYADATAIHGDVCYPNLPHARSHPLSLSRLLCSAANALQSLPLEPCVPSPTGSTTAQSYGLQQQCGDYYGRHAAAASISRDERRLQPFFATPLHSG